LNFIGREDVREELKTNPVMGEFLSVIASTAPNLISDRRQSAAGAPVFFGDVDVSREYYAVTGVLADVKAGRLKGGHYATASNGLEFLIAKHSESGQTEPTELLRTLRDDLEMLYQDETGFDQVLADMAREVMDKYASMLSAKRGSEAARPPSGASELHVPGRVAPQKMISIDQGKLDKTIDLSGEITAVSEFMNYLHAQFAEGKMTTNLDGLKDATAALQEHSEALSRNLHDLRKVPVSEAFQNLHRVARDTAASLGKKARLVMSGERTPVDKSVASKLETMLVHLVRNSVDHGLEPPEKRAAVGKPEEGAVFISAAQEGGSLVIRVGDDGRGIDVGRLKRALVEKGLATTPAAEGMGDQRAIDHVFLPGFSMSDKVTETSGRGVGMDAVLSLALELGGGARLVNRPGEGLTTVVSIPVTHTTLVKKGLAVAVGRSVFFIPNESVLESFRPSREEVYTIRGKREMVRRRGEILTLVRLYGLLGAASAVKDPNEGILVMVQNKKRRACLLVDGVIGQRQIIYKRLAVKTLREPSPFEGVSIYEGNKLAMILDVDGVIEQSQNEERRP
ncbi:MAG: chemotaxis protein CheW, partial [Nitrospinae bacterium]|nr:chemotaxis protein CheW [Nitrospinota bacterium]